MSEAGRAIIREANTGSDHAFLYSTWRNALWYAEKRDPKEADSFYKTQSDEIAKILRSDDARTKIACLGDDSDMLLGWAVFLGTHLKFVYVKIDYRGKGIGKLLTKGFKTFDEPQTKIGKSLKEKYGRKEETAPETPRGLEAYLPD
jgi:ribosomal protein S18 acetylase RimI-like enzyme